MKLQNTLRSLVRRLGLRKLLLPIVEMIEDRRIKNIGTYSVSRNGNTLTYDGFGRTIEIANLSEDLCILGLSRHERTTITTVLGRLGPGGVAWDVGANVGFYTKLMSETASKDGAVFGFEPNDTAYAELVRTVAGCKNVKLIKQALGNSDGMANMTTSVDHSSISRIVNENEVAANEITSIMISRGDSVIGSNTAQQPNFLKIDVEGHELEVLQGMSKLLASPSCKTVLVEVHFEILNQLGRPDAPDQIVALLSASGLTKQTWIGRSHLLAERPANQ